MQTNMNCYYHAINKLKVLGILNELIIFYDQENEFYARFRKFKSIVSQFFL